MYNRGRVRWTARYQGQPQAGVGIPAITGLLRDLEQRVVEATCLGAVAYLPSGQCGEVEVEPEEAEAQLRLFEE